MNDEREKLKRSLKNKIYSYSLYGKVIKFYDYENDGHFTYIFDDEGHMIKKIMESSFNQRKLFFVEGDR